MNKIKITVSSGEPCVTTSSASEHAIIIVDLPGFSVPESYLVTDLAALLSIVTGYFS